MIAGERPYVVVSLKHDPPRRRRVWARSHADAAAAAAWLRENLTGPLRVFDEYGNAREFFTVMEGRQVWISEGLEEPEWAAERRQAGRRARESRLERLRMVYGPGIGLRNPWL